MVEEPGGFHARTMPLYAALHFYCCTLFDMVVALIMSLYFLFSNGSGAIINGIYGANLFRRWR